VRKTFLIFDRQRRTAQRQTTIISFILPSQAYAATVRRVSSCDSRTSIIWLFQCDHGGNDGSGIDHVKCGSSNGNNQMVAPLLSHYSIWWVALFAGHGTIIGYQSFDLVVVVVLTG
jgi:hypothetical protein